MDQDGQHLLAFVIAAAMLARAHRTFHYRIDDFQMRGVERQRQVHGPAGRGDIGRKSLVVFHIA